MVDEQTEKRIRDLKEAMRKERGRSSPQWEYAAEQDVDFQEAYNNLYEKGLTAGKALPVKTRELVAIAILAYRGNADAVYEHMKRAIKYGATKRELLEAIETALVPGGAPTFSTGLRALKRIDEEDKKAK
jgi:AhpD family alkylhydroperoxidase